MKDAQVCAKPGCQGETVAWLTYDYAGRRLWLDGVPHVGGDQWGLCMGHAERLRAPVGWARVDRRLDASLQRPDETGEVLSRSDRLDEAAGEALGVRESVAPAETVAS